MRASGRASRGGRSALAALRSVEVVLTPECNLRCGYCYQGVRPRGRIPEEILRASIDALLASMRPEVTLHFHGGEPLLAFDALRRAVECAGAAPPGGPRVSFQLTTNGTLLDAPRAAFLAVHRVQTRLSFDGVPAAQELRAAGTFARLDGLLDQLRREHPSFFLDRLEVAVTLTAANLQALSETVTYFLRKSVRTVRVSPRLTPEPGWHEGLLSDLERQVSRVADSSLAQFRRTGQVPVTFLRRAASPPGATRPYSGWTCGIAEGSNICVDVDGEVTGCALLAASCQSFAQGPLTDRLRPMRLGSILDPGLQRRLVTHRTAARATGLFHHRERKHSLFGPCRRCGGRWECMVCPLSAVYVPGNRDPNLVPDLPCAFNRVTARYRARFPPQPSLADVLNGRVSPLPALAIGR